MNSSLHRNRVDCCGFWKTCEFLNLLALVTPHAGPRLRSSQLAGSPLPV